MLGYFVRHKIVITLMICIILLMVALLLFNFSIKKSTCSNELRTDNGPILSRFPNIGNIEKCIWKAELIGNSRVSVPGPSGYRMKGYVLLNRSDVEKYKNQFKWNEVENGWKPTLDESVLKLKDNSLIWLHSDEFNNYVMTNSYFGEFFINFDNGIIYFEAEQ